MHVLLILVLPTHVRKMNTVITVHVTNLARGYTVPLVNIVAKVLVRKILVTANNVLKMKFVSQGIV